MERLLSGLVSTTAAAGLGLTSWTPLARADWR